jgi:hypothetical protein
MSATKQRMSAAEPQHYLDSELRDLKKKATMTRMDWQIEARLLGVTMPSFEHDFCKPNHFLPFLFRILL